MTRPATGIVLGGRYRLQDRIAAGGMGTVWVAEDETLHRRVAVKILNEGLSADERFTERFRQEARAAAGLSHPNIAGVFDYGEDDGRPYIVMELIDGETLADRLERLGRLDPSETARIGAAVAEALAVAHAAGIVHRDVKPANIMLDRADRVRVMDFGIAATVQGSSGLTATGAVMGTSRYISPEQAEGDRAVPASDVYSLGIVLYETLAGEPPFARQTPVATALAHIHERPRPVEGLRPDTPSELADAVGRCLAKDPALRPTPSELATALGAAGAGAAQTTPITVGGDTQVLTLPPAEQAATPAHREERRTIPLGLRVPPGTMDPDRSRRQRRTRWLIAAGIVAILLLILGLVLSGGKGRVKMPDFAGLSRHAASVKAKHLGLDPVFRTRASDATPGQVIEQLPSAGRHVPEGITVFLTVSSGPAVSASPSPPPEPSPKPKPSGHGHDHGHGKGKGNEGEG